MPTIDFYAAAGTFLALGRIVGNPEVIQRDLFHHHAETLALVFRPRPISRSSGRRWQRAVSTSGWPVNQDLSAF
jgi:hypothetical protein